MLILEIMNKIYSKNGNRINESTDWIHYFHYPKNGWSGSQNLIHYRHYCWTHIRNLSLGDVTLINEDPYKSECMLYILKKKITRVEEKDLFLVHEDEKLRGITVHKTNDVKYYVSEDHYLNRDKILLKNLPSATYVMRRDADTEFPNHYPIGMMRSFYEKYAYEVLNHNTATRITLTKDDFILPTTRTKPSTNT